MIAVLDQIIMWTLRVGFVLWALGIIAGIAWAVVLWMGRDK